MLFEGILSSMYYCYGSDAATEVKCRDDCRRTIVSKDAQSWIGFNVRMNLLLCCYYSMCRKGDQKCKR